MLNNNYADEANHENECESGEDMKAAFEKFNSLDKKNRMECEMVSMDAKALYPSMRWDLIVKAVRMMIENSELEIKNVDYHEVGKYLSIMMSEEEILAEGLVYVIPKRKQGQVNSEAAMSNAMTTQKYTPHVLKVCTWSNSASWVEGEKS